MTEKKVRPKTIDEIRRGRVLVRKYLNHLFGLHENTDLEGTAEEIAKGIDFRGANLWTLIFAIFIASIGLNMNSTAVVIGAMLISPLMGPIVGAGFGLGTNDFHLFKRAFRNLSVAIVIAILTSSFYFFLSPFKEAQSEILSRTTPTAFDVFIAIFGGLTGIVAASRKVKGNAIPGVAIATALMPPLCTVGYGIANAQFKLAFGAFYLFLINGLFIGVSTLAVTKYLRFPVITYVDPNKARRVKFLIYTVVILTVIPSVFTVINILQEGLFQRRVNTFVEQQFKFPGTAILMKKTKVMKDSSELEITIFGKYLPEEAIKKLESELQNYQLPTTKLTVLQQNNDISSFDKTALSLRQEILDMNQKVKSSIIEDLYHKNEETIKDKDAKIKILEDEVVRIKGMGSLDSNQMKDIMNQLAILFPKIKGFSLNKSPTALSEKDSLVLDSIPRVLLYWHKKQWMTSKEKEKLEAYLKTQFKKDTLVFEHIR